MRAGLYARVSTERQADRGTIGSQLALLREHIAAAGDELVGEYVDDGHSGARLDRPGLDALRDAAEAGLIERVWCLSPDRLARAYAYQVVACACWVSTWRWACRARWASPQGGQVQEMVQVADQHCAGLYRPRSAGGDGADGRYRLDVGTKAERRAAREAVASYHEARLGELIEYIASAIDRHGAGEVDAYTVDETIHHYHWAARELWKLGWSGGGGMHIEMIAHVIDRMTTDGETINWWEQVSPRQPD